MPTVHLPFDLVILDLDGTILDLYHPAPISQPVRNAIAAVQAAGIPVTIATGRTLDYVRENIHDLGITTPVVTTQGAVVGDPVTGKILTETLMPLDIAREAAAWIDAHPYVTALYFTDENGRTQIYQNRNGTEPNFYEHVFGNPRTLHPTFQELLAERTDGASVYPPIKFIVVDDSPSDVDLEAALITRFSPALHISRTHPRLVEGTAQGVDKGAGTRRLCKMLGIDPQRVLAIGDSDNDIPVIETVGFGVAMGNASPGVKAVADWHAPSVEEDGAAVALQVLVLNQIG